MRILSMWKELIMENETWGYNQGWLRPESKEWP